MPQTSGTSTDLISVYFIDTNTGWVVGAVGTIQWTTDGGTNWTSQTSGTTEILWSVYFTENNTIWVVGGRGTILKTTTGGTTFIEEQEIEEIPTDYSLSQNYPNPFNPTETIKYQIPKLSFVTLKIYNILGNEIVTLLNEEKFAGNYEAEFKPTTLPSGIYFYQLQAGSFVETKKMVLIK